MRRSEDQLVIELYNFQDWHPRRFTPHELWSIGNGFVAETRTAEEVGSFEAFRRMLQEARVSDECYCEMRTTTYEREGLELGICYDPQRMTDKFRETNGLPEAFWRIRVWCTQWG